MEQFDPHLARIRALAKVREVLVLASDIVMVIPGQTGRVKTAIRPNLNIDDVKVEFNLRGRQAAQARRLDGKCRLRINMEAFAMREQEMLDESIPHEVAHLVCFVLGIDDGHGPAWKKICIELGGTGKQYHDMILTPARKSKRFLYRNTHGQEVAFKIGRHINLQKGKVAAYTVKRNGAIFTRGDLVGEMT